MSSIIFDGGFGTYILNKFPDLPYPEMAVITHHEEVLKLHIKYIKAGAQAIQTASFSVSSALVPLTKEREKLYKASWNLASQAVKGKDVKIFVDIGPINSDTASQQYVEKVSFFKGLGATNFIFETQHEVSSLISSINYIKQNIKGACIICSFAAGQDGYTKTGSYFKDLFDLALELGVDYVGLNCVCGPAHMLELVKTIEKDKYPLSIMPNAGYPIIENGKSHYRNNPIYFAEKMAAIAAVGVSVFGGCCGTEPNHIKALADVLKNPSCKEEIIKPQILQKQKATKSKISDNKPIIAVEIASPINADIEHILEAARMAKDGGADFVTIPDSPLGKARANSMMMSVIVKNSVGIPVIPHLCCRDKNQIAIKGDLLAANIGGVEAVLAITGDSVPEVDRNEAKNVFGFNSYKLISFIRSLNACVFAENPFTICAALNLNAKNFQAELSRAKRKIEEGATWFLTQPVFSKLAADRYNDAKKVLNAKILVGIMPIAGYKNAMFLNNEVPGIDIPQELVDKLYGLEPEENKVLCIEYTKEIIDYINCKEKAHGYYIVTPLRKLEFSKAILNYIKEKY